jgi:hypothetical protein
VWITTLSTECIILVESFITTKHKHTSCKCPPGAEKERERETGDCAALKIVKKVSEYNHNI